MPQPNIYRDWRKISMQSYMPAKPGGQPMATKAIAKMGENWSNWAGARRFKTKSAIKPIQRFTGMTMRPN